MIEKACKAKIKMSLSPGPDNFDQYANVSVSTESVYEVLDASSTRLLYTKL
jgi:hypothetical protein